MKSLILHIALIFVPPILPQDAPMSLREACSWTSGMPMTYEESVTRLRAMGGEPVPEWCNGCSLCEVKP